MVRLCLSSGDNVDGGPYANARVTEVRPDLVVLEHEDGTTTEIRPELLEDEIADEINADEPISVSGSAPKWDMSSPGIRLPIREGWILTAHSGETWDPRTDTRGDLHDVRHAVYESGGSLTTN